MPLNIAFADGFDHYPVSTSSGVELGLRSVWQASGSGSVRTQLITPGLNGRGAALRIDSIDNSSGQLIRTIPSHTALSLHFGIRFGNIDNDHDSFERNAILGFSDAANALQFYLRTRPTGRIALIRGTTVLGETSRALVPDIAFRLSFAADLAAGTATMAVNGSVEDGFDLSGIDLTNTANPDVQIVSIHSPDASAGSDDQLYDIDDMLYGYGEAILIPELEIITDYPTEDFLKQWTPLSGTDNFAMVDDNPPDLDTTYNHSALVGNRDLFGFAPLPVAPDSIVCLSLMSAVKKEESATRAVKHAIEQSAALDYGSQLNLSTTYQWYQSHWTENPQTLSEWLQAEIEAAHFGYEDAA